ncbi:MAG: metalloregulator ArsR/SmtB family transcription factor [Phycisphaerae bacterium]|jgi:ArsR family transcriptional regulator
MAPIGQLFKAVAETTRQRLLQVLAGRELSVSELVAVLRLPQSTVSRHLKVLREAGLLVDRRVGTAVLYTTREPDHARPGGNGHAAADLREHLLNWAGQEPMDARIAERLDRVLRRRNGQGGFFERIGTRWDQLRVEAFGECFHFEALSALLPSEWTVADLGAGTGYLLPVLAGRFRRVIAVDPASAMLEAARNRPELRAAANVEFREGSLEKLPLADGELDLAIASLVLHHLARPTDGLAELRRVVRTPGRLLIVEQREHDNDAFHERMGDVFRGFEPRQLQEWVRSAGFVDIQVCPLASARPAARQEGTVPGLFALVARG